MATTQMEMVIRHLRQVTSSHDRANASDAQLLSSFIQQRDESAFEALVRRFGPMVLGVCRRVVRNHHDAEDAFQATFFVLARKAPCIKPRERVASWLHGVALRTALKLKSSIARRSIREKQVLTLPEPDFIPAEHSFDLQSLIDQELARLPEIYRLPVLLCDLQLRSIKEATQFLDWPQGTLAGRLVRGRKLLATRLTRRGITLTSGLLISVLSPNTVLSALPPVLVSSTVTSAAIIAAGKEMPTGVISHQVGSLMKGVCKSMFLNRLKGTFLWAFAVIALVIGLGLGSKAEQPPEPQTNVPSKKQTQSTETHDLAPKVHVDPETLTQVQLDVSLISGPIAMLELPELKAGRANRKANELSICMLDSDISRLIQHCRAKHGAKVLAEPRLITRSSRPARFLSGGQVAVPKHEGAESSREIEFVNVGIELTMLPIVRNDKTIYLEITPVIRAVSESLGIKTKDGSIPGFTEQSSRVAAELKPRQTLLACIPEGDKVTIICVTPQAIEVSKPVDVPKPRNDRSVVVAKQLVQKYHEALSRGERELAREFAQMALDLDPACFGKPTQAEPCSHETPTLPAP